MRSLNLALLAAIPAAAFGAHTATRASLQPSTTASARTARDTAAAFLGGPDVRGGDAERTSRFAAALADVDADVSLGEVVCSEQQVDSRAEHARYVAGVRRSDNPEYLAASEALAGAHAALLALQTAADQARADTSTLLDQAESQDARTEALREESRHARHATADAQTTRADTLAALEDARLAGARLQSLQLERQRLEDQIQALRAALPGQEAALARAREAAAATDPARPDRDAEARQTALSQAVTQARGALETAEAALATAREALQSGRGVAVSPDERHAQREALLAAQAEQATRQQALETAEAALAAAAPAHPAAEAADTTDDAVRSMERALRQQQHTLRRAEEALAQVPAPSRELRAQAEQADTLERRLRHQQGEVRVTERLQAEVEGRLAAQEVRAMDIRQRLTTQTEVLEQAQARLQAQQDLILTQEAAVAGVPAELSQTLRGEVEYTIVTWARTCGVEATVRWQDRLGESWTRTFGAEATDTDLAHPAQPQARIAANLLDYGRSDTDRVQEADQALLAQIRAALEVRAAPQTARLGG